MRCHLIVVSLDVSPGLEACDTCRGDCFAALALAKTEELLAASTVIVVSVVSNFQEIHWVDSLLSLLGLRAVVILSINLVKAEGQSFKGHRASMVHHPRSKMRGGHSVDENLGDVDYVLQLEFNGVQQRHRTTFISKLRWRVHVGLRLEGLVRL